MPSLIPEDLTQPGTHALVIGVSEYLHFGDGVEPTQKGDEFNMGQLSAAARSASEFAAWLLNDHMREELPLNSLRVLLSPSNGEQIQPDIKALLNGDYSANITNVKAELAAFRRACDAHADNIIIVYVAGHGIQLTKHGAIVLLNDIGSEEHLSSLEGAIDMAGVHAGMNHPGTAKTQFWFVDICRQKPTMASQYEELTGALKIDSPNGDTEASPLFLAACTGKAAYARVKGVTLFNEALMWVLRGGVAAGPEDGKSKNYHVSVSELIKRLPERVEALAEAEGVKQSVDITGKVHEAVFHEYKDTPFVNLRVELVPDEAKQNSIGTLSRPNDEVPVLENFNNWPLQDSFKAGLYILNIQADAPYVSKNNILALLPPAEPIEVNVEA